MSKQKGYIGTAFEERIIQAKTGLSKSQTGIKNNSIHDIPAGTYVSNNGVNVVTKNVSCKATKDNSVDCGDISRFFNETTKDEDLEIVVGEYEKSGNVASFNKITVFSISKEHQKTLWGGISSGVLNEFDEYVKSIPHGRAGQEANIQVWKDKRQAIYDTYNQGKMKIAAKIDKKKQRRVQCTFNIKDMIEAGIPYDVYTDQYEGIKISDYKIIK